MPASLSTQRDVSNIPVVIEYRVGEAEKQVKDHENRINKVENAIIKYDTIIWLTLGGGFIGLIDFMALVYLIISK